MTGKYLLSAASVALFIAASSAQAADVTPILAAGVPPVAAVETDPTVSLEVENWTRMGFNGFYLQNYTTIEGTIDWASGWHLEIEEIEFGADLGGFEAFGDFRFYRSIGNFEVGAEFGGGGGCDWGFSCGAGAGINPFVAYEYDDDRLFFRSELSFGFGWFDSYTEFNFDVTDQGNVWGELEVDGGGLDELAAGFEYDLTDQLNIWAELEIDGGGFDDLDVDFTYAVTDQLNIWAELDWDFGPFEFDDFDVGFEYNVTDQLMIWAEMDFDFGPFEFDYLEVGFEYNVTDQLMIWAELDWALSPFAFEWFEIGAEFEQQVGTGPFTLLADTSLDVWNGGFDFEVGVGFGYTIGGN